MESSSFIQTRSKPKYGSYLKNLSDIFAGNYGVLIEEGEKWHEIRSRVQQDMMRPKSATFYLDKIQDISDELVQYIRRQRNPDSLQVRLVTI